jgi:tetratricopeptide (TPR) repeat protein
MLDLHVMKPLILFLVLLTGAVIVHGQAALEKGKRFYEDGKPTEARKIFTAIAEDQKDYAAAQYYLGRIAFDENKLDDAEEFFEEAIDHNDKAAEYHNWYGNALGRIAQNANMVRQGLLAPKMKNAWERAVQLNPQYVDPRQSLIQFYLQAPGFMGGSVEKAKQMAVEIKKVKPAEGHRQMGNIYVHEKKMPEAEKEFIAMAKADPVYVSGLANFYVNQQQYDKAFSLFDDLFKKNPDDMMVAYQYGRASAISGQHLDKGEEYLKKYLVYTPQPDEPSHAGANMRLGQIQEKRGNKANAKRHYETALKIDGSLKEAKEGLQRVSK